MNYELFKHTTKSKKNKSIFLVNMTREINHHFSELTLKGLEKYIKTNKKIGILVNKKGYSNGIICQNCGYVPQCTKCSINIAYHKLDNQQTIGLCHLCKTQYNVPTFCSECGKNTLNEFGIGTQKVADFIKQNFNKNSFIIESETVNSPNKIKKILNEIKQSPDSQIIIGTSLLTTPIYNQIFDLIIFLNADLGLNIPDYTASSKNFYFLYETFIKHQSSNFIVQSFKPDHYSIRNACKLSPQDFFKNDNIFKEQNNYPPFAEICVISYKNEIEENVFNKIDKLYKELLYLQQKYQFHKIEIYSTPPLIYKIFGKYRYNIILKGKEVRNFLDIAYSKLDIYSKNFKFDRMAQSTV